MDLLLSKLAISGVQQIIFIKKIQTNQKLIRFMKDKLENKLNNKKQENGSTKKII